MEVYSLVVGAIQENCYIAAGKNKNAAVIDPGDNAIKIAQVVEEKGLEVKMILLTHGHFDHIGAAKELSAKWGAPIYAARAEEKLLGSARLNRAGFRYGDDERFNVTADVWLDDGDVIALDELEFHVIATPGHSAGSVCYLCGDYLFSGDTLFAGDVGRCDLYSGDFDAMKDSMKKLKTLTKDYKVLPGHGPVSTLDREKTVNPYMTGDAL